jgi:O-acetyl-ADP-ribose deacetylase (regulator of RNase III)
VIHAVGPIWGTGNEEAKLASAVRAALDLADQRELRSISMPGISSGIFGFPKPLCAQVMLGAILGWLNEHRESSVCEVNACNIDGETARLFEAEARGRFER